MKSECESCRELLERAFLEELPADETGLLERHLSSCKSCRLEHSELAQAIALLGSAEDAPVPRHFFVYPDRVKVNPLALWRRLAPAWQGVLGILLVLSVAIAAASAVRMQVQVLDRGLYVGFAAPPFEREILQVAPALDEHALQVRVVQTVLESLRRDDAARIRLLRAETARFAASLSPGQRRELENMLATIEARLGSRLAATAAAIQLENAESMHQLYLLVSFERAHDAALLDNKVTQLVIDTEMKQSKTDAILDSLIQVAELKMK